MSIKRFVRSEANGDAMWAPEATAGDVAMMRVPVGIFSEQIADIPAARYTKLPKPAGYTFQNRFVGEHLLFGTGSSWGYAQPKQENKLFVHKFASSDTPRDLSLPHPAGRIEVMGGSPVTTHEAVHRKARTKLSTFASSVSSSRAAKVALRTMIARRRASIGTATRARSSWAVVRSRSWATRLSKERWNRAASASAGG